MTPAPDLSAHKYAYGNIRSNCPAALELIAIKRCLYDGDHWKDASGQVAGLTLAEHTRRFAKLAWPNFVWHRWSNMLLETISANDCTAVWGPASSGKTAVMAVVMLSWYWAAPTEFTGLCSTTDLIRLELRIFGEIKKRFKEARERYPWLAGNLIDSRQRIVTQGKGEEGRDFRCGILGIACQKSSGEVQGLSSYAGIKNRFVMLAADEVHTMTASFTQGANNLKSNNNEGRFIAIYSGNLVDLETPLGTVAEPDCGWDALPDSDVSRVYKTKTFGGKAVQFVGMDSPNFDMPGREAFPYLIGPKFIERLRHDCGEGSPEYISQAGGLIPRSSLANRVITKEVCQKFNAFEPITWGAEKLTKLYAMDVSYTVDHGDRTVGIPMVFGKDIENKLRLAFLERPRVFSFFAVDQQTVEEHIASETRKELDRLEIPYSHFYYDGTGRSSFTAAAMRVIGTMIQPVEFGGRASERPNFIGRKYTEGLKKGELLTCSEIFDKFVTELWFATRYLIEADQLRGLPEDTAKDGYQRLWKLVAGNKMSVEPKKEMKKRLNRSPDLYDAFAVSVEGARRLGFVIGKDSDSRNARGAAWLGGIGRDMQEALKKQELSYG
jgi:hypothetical protein